MDKLQIFYQPRRTHPDYWDSVTLSFYDYNESQGTYKTKIVCEVRGETFKKKEVRTDLPVIAEKLANLVIANRASVKVSSDEAYFYIKYGDLSMTTSTAADIQDVLEQFNFQEALDMFDAVSQSK